MVSVLVSLATRPERPPAAGRGIERDGRGNAQQEPAPNDLLGGLNADSLSSTLSCHRSSPIRQVSRSTPTAAPALGGQPGTSTRRLRKRVWCEIEHGLRRATSEPQAGAPRGQRRSLALYATHLRGHRRAPRGLLPGWWCGFDSRRPIQDCSGCSAACFQSFKISGLAAPARISDASGVRPGPIDRYVSMVVLIGRRLVIGSAWRCATFQVSPSRRKIKVTRRAIGLMSRLPANRAWVRSSWTT